jgi:hypothetical protein
MYLFDENLIIIQAEFYLKTLKYFAVVEFNQNKF